MNKLRGGYVSRSLNAMVLGSSIACAIAYAARTDYVLAQEGALKHVAVISSAVSSTSANKAEPVTQSLEMSKPEEKGRLRIAQQDLHLSQAGGITVEPVEPVNGVHGPISFRIRTPWLQGHIELRFPETLQSRGQLHFIDHIRPDMPPTDTIGSIDWKRDSSSGSLSYSVTTEYGLVFGGTVAPLQDALSLEFRVRNNSDNVVNNIMNQMCLVLTNAPGFSEQHDLSHEFAWIDGKYTSLKETTPTPEQKNRRPWIMLPTKEMANVYSGARDWPDGWWVVDQTADYNLIARENEDRTHLVAIAWDAPAAMLMTNTNIPCRHAGPSNAFTLNPGEEAKWLGRIFLMENSPEKLLVDYRVAASEWKTTNAPKDPLSMNFETMFPDELESMLRESPVAYVPLGTLEFHGQHLPFGFDALKARAVCERIAKRTGGAVLPPTYHGFAGAHREFAGSIISEEVLFRDNLRITCERLIAMGFRVLVLLTGHYPKEQMDAVHAMADEIMKKHPGITVIGLAEPEAYPGEFRGDHAAKWETSVGMYVLPDYVRMERMDNHTDPLYGLYGEDPRGTASLELGQETVERIIETISEQVTEAIAASESSSQHHVGP